MLMVPETAQNVEVKLGCDVNEISAVINMEIRWFRENISLRSI